MRSAKPYTNATFTRRVDHDGGLHRPSRAPSEPRLCSQCGAAYLRRRWVPAGDPRAVALRATGATATVCRGCREVAGQMPSGYLTIEGRFLSVHRFEIEQLLEHEARHAAEDNPLARIIRWDRSNPARLELTTTTEHLADRLGHALHSAYRGMVRYDYSHENKVVRVSWHRD
jgi:hypothetical protein